MNEELAKEWEQDRQRINNISERIYDEENECFDIWEYACELEQLATKYLYRFRGAESLRTKSVEEVAE